MRNADSTDNRTPGACQPLSSELETAGMARDGTRIRVVHLEAVWGRYTRLHGGWRTHEDGISVVVRLKRARGRRAGSAVPAGALQATAALRGLGGGACVNTCVVL